MTAKNTDGLRGNRWAAVWARVRTLRRWGLAVAERVPLTFLGLLALPLLFWVLLPYALKREDRVPLAVSLLRPGPVRRGATERADHRPVPVAAPRRDTTAAAGA